MSGVGAVAGLASGEGLMIAGSELYLYDANTEAFGGLVYDAGVAVDAVYALPNGDALILGGTAVHVYYGSTRTGRLLVNWPGVGFTDIAPLLDSDALLLQGNGGVSRYDSSADAWIETGLFGSGVSGMVGLAAVAAIPGDANGDGCVDDLDLTALAVNWQQGCGGGGSFADAWTAGQAAAGANVPEPASALLVLLGFVSVAHWRRRN